MKHLSKYAALVLALSLCLTTLAGCANILPSFGKDNPPVQEPEQGQEQGQEGQTDPTDQTAPELLSDTIVCCDGDATLRFEKNEEGVWRWKDDPEFPLDTTYVDALANTVQAVLATQPIVTDKTLEDLDLDSQQKYLTVTDEKGYRITWYLGDQDDNGCYYMCLAGDDTNAIYLAPVELTEQISRSIYDMMILPQLQAIAADHITSVTITAGGKTVTTVPNSAGVWVVGISSVNELAQPMLQGLSQMQIAGCVDYKPIDGVTAICGLEPPQATVEVEFASSTGVESFLTFSIGAKLNRGYCVMLPEDSTIYLVKPEVVEPILAFMK